MARPAFDWEEEFERVTDAISTNDLFRATVYAMNGLLLAKGVYTHEEFARQVIEWKRKKEARTI